MNTEFVYAGFLVRTLGGKSYSGTVKEIDNETVMVSCSDGVVRCTSLTLSEMGRDEMGNKKES